MKFITKPIIKIYCHFSVSIVLGHFSEKSIHIVLLITTPCPIHLSLIDENGEIIVESLKNLLGQNVNLRHPIK